MNYKNGLAILILCAPVLAQSTHHYAPVLIESAPGQYSHPGTPLSVVRVIDETDAPASVIRLSLRSLYAEQAGHGPAITLQAPHPDDPHGPDVDMAHFLFQWTREGGVQISLVARKPNGGYETVAAWRTY